MKNQFRILGAIFALLAAHITSADAQLPLVTEPERKQVEPMSFEQCTEILRNYEGEFGPLRVVLDAPTLRVVQFVSNDQTEQVSCDGDDNLITVLELGSESER